MNSFISGLYNENDKLIVSWNKLREDFFVMKKTSLGKINMDKLIEKYRDENPVCLKLTDTSNALIDIYSRTDKLPGIKKLVLGESFVSDICFPNAAEIEEIYLSKNFSDFSGKVGKISRYANAKIFIDRYNPYFISVDGIVFNRKLDSLFHYPKAGKVIVFNGITKIMPYAITSDVVKDIFLPSTIEKVDETAFKNVEDVFISPLSPISKDEDFKTIVDKCKVNKGKTSLHDFTIESLVDFDKYSLSEINEILSESLEFKTA